VFVDAGGAGGENESRHKRLQTEAGVRGLRSPMGKIDWGLEMEKVGLPRRTVNERTPRLESDHISQTFNVVSGGSCNQGVEIRGQSQGVQVFAGGDEKSI